MIPESYLSMRILSMVSRPETLLSGVDCVPSGENDRNLLDEWGLGPTYIQADDLGKLLVAAHSHGWRVHFRCLQPHEEWSPEHGIRDIPFLPFELHVRGRLRVMPHTRAVLYGEGGWPEPKPNMVIGLRAVSDGLFRAWDTADPKTRTFVDTMTPGMRAELKALEKDFVDKWTGPVPAWKVMG